MFEGMVIHMMQLCKHTQKNVFEQKILMQFPADEKAKKANYKANITLLASYLDYIVSPNNVCCSSEVLTVLN